jgi:hypothetical protein
MIAVTCTAPPVVEMYLGDETPLLLWVLDSADDLIDFAEPHTFQGRLVADGAVLFTTTTGFTGAAGTLTEYDDAGIPNLTKEWPTSGELNDITASGPYIFQIVATRTADSVQLTFDLVLNLKRRY